MSSSEEIGLVPSQRLENGLNSQLVFQDETLRFNCSAQPRRVGDPGPKTRELTGFIDEKMFSSVDRDRFFTPHGSEFRRPIYGGEPPDRRDSCDWNGNGSTTTPSGDGSDEDDEDDDDEGDGEVEGLVCGDDGNKSNTNNNSSGSVHSVLVADKMGNGKSKHLSSFGTSRDILAKDGSLGQSLNNMRVSSGENHQQGQGRVGNFQNAVTIAEQDGEMYYSQYLHNTEGSVHGQKDLGVDNGCGFSGRKDISLSSESGESLRSILSDPVTGALMDDAMILPCGHSFGSGGLQHIMRMKACYTCSHPISEDSVSPNLSLRYAVQAFCREEELQFYRSSKRRRERFEQEKGAYGDPSLMDPPRGRGVQFPFSVTDRVIIKGNKRTPQRFVGREAIVTTQCLNGWYVVKTLDNAESVKLQYRSLAKVSDDPSSKSTSSKMTPNWL